jgi:hypothetical protein
MDESIIGIYARLFYGGYRMIDIDKYGIFKIGLTREEIQMYLKDRYEYLVREGFSSVKSYKKIADVYKKFDKVAGVNTCAAVKCPHCFKLISVMYYHDVLRYANVVFGITKDTYFD